MIAALVVVSNGPEIGGNPDVVHSVAGVVMLAWLTTLTVRHTRTYPGDRGRGVLIASWLAAALFLVFAIVQAIDTAAFDDGVVEGLVSLAAGPPVALFIVPLVLGSIAILMDAHPRPTPHPPGAAAAG